MEDCLEYTPYEDQSLQILSLPICNGPLESVQHILLGCLFIKVIWRSSRWPLDPTVFEMQHIEVWIRALIRPHEVLFVPLAEVLVFQILAARNSCVHNRLYPNMHNVVVQIQTMISYHLKAWVDSISTGSLELPP